MLRICVDITILRLEGIVMRSAVRWLGQPLAGEVLARIGENVLMGYSVTPKNKDIRDISGIKGTWQILETEVDFGDDPLQALAIASGMANQISRFFVGLINPEPVIGGIELPTILLYEYSRRIEMENSLRKSLEELAALHKRITTILAELPGYAFTDA